MIKIKLNIMIKRNLLPAWNLVSLSLRPIHLGTQGEVAGYLPSFTYLVVATPAAMVRRCRLTSC